MAFFDDVQTILTDTGEGEGFDLGRWLKLPEVSAGLSKSTMIFVGAVAVFLLGGLYIIFGRKRKR